MSILYHVGKANVISDALSRLSMVSTSHVEEGKRELGKDVPRFTRLRFKLVDSRKGRIVVTNGAELSLA